MGHKSLPSLIALSFEGFFLLNIPWLSVILAREVGGRLNSFITYPLKNFLLCLNSSLICECGEEFRANKLSHYCKSSSHWLSTES